MNQIRTIIFFIIAQDYFQLTPLWKPQILLKQLYTFLIALRYSTLRCKQFDFLVLCYLSVSFCLMIVQLYSYTVTSSQYLFFELLRAQYPLLMCFSILIIYGHKKKPDAGLFLRVLQLLVWINILLNVVITITGLEEKIANSYDVFEFSFNQNIVVFFIFLQAVKMYSEKSFTGKRNRLFMLLLLLALINIPNFQRARFIIIVLILLIFYLRQVSWKIKLIFPLVAAVISFFLFRTEKFSNILEAFVSREDAIDPSLAGRFIQVQQILTTDFNPIYGFGFLTAKTKDNFFDEAYFHPSDTGIFGIYFNGGYLGILLFLLLMIIAIREMLKFRDRETVSDQIELQAGNIKLAAVLMISYILLNSFFTASLFYDPMFLISYLYLIKRF